MTSGVTLATAGHGPSPVILGAFLVGGIIAIWTGMNWALDLRGITTRRWERIRHRQHGPWDVTGTAGDLDATGDLLARPGYLRLLGAVMALAGLLLILVAYALWQLG
ncbi:hypothetical protein ABZ930_15070 [Streptomyces sp. NPDC046716]|uniref:hypothetical protein n=1 Tax=Streptomyces sp. NPDC046716 TaxID=3157093 RepID=UPI0033F49A70